MKESPLSEFTGLSDGLMSTGARGMHLLFDAPAIRRAFSRLASGLVSEGHLMSAHHALRHLEGLGCIAQMREYLGHLPDATVDLLVYLYFRRLDQFLEATPRTLH